MFWIGYISGIIATGIIVGIVLGKDIFFSWNRKHVWYKWYCYFTSFCYSDEQKIRLYKAGYITEKHLRKMLKKTYTHDQIDRIVLNHNKAVKILNDMKERYYMMT